MCGIAAIIATRGSAASLSAVQRMTDTIRHRGPDDVGFFTRGAVAFGFRRLSILDLTPSGHQPFESADGSCTIIFNGEIYNYIELRRELESLGHTFRSTGDTEVLLHAYQEWGRDCLEKLNGMWAFLIYDDRRRVVFGARDRFGVKPLFRARTPDHVLFASEIKAIRASGLCTARPNWTLTAEFLCRSSLVAPNDGEATFFENIEQVPAGGAFELALDGRMTEWRYWSLDDVTRAAVADPPGSLYSMFEDSVRLRMRSDVPVGVSLSGGLDSTAILSVMARLREEAGIRVGEALHAFSYVSEEFDESAYIAQTIDRTGATLNRVDIDPARLWEGMDEVLWYHDEPLHSPTALISFEIYRLAARMGVKVVLCGQGADESLGGYTSYFIDYWCTLVRQGRVARAWDEIRANVERHGGNRATLFRTVLDRVAKTDILGRIAPYRHAAAKRRRARERAGQLRWFTRELTDALTEPDASRQDPTLDTALRRSVNVGPLPLYLRIEDRNSMAHSVEARLPFMDYRLISLAFQLSDDWKVRGPYNKYVLRHALRGHIPEGVRTRIEKMGFPSPVQSWFRGPFHDALQDVLSSAAARERGIYDVAAIRADLARHRRGEISVGNALFNVAQFERWLTLPDGSPARAGAAVMPLAEAPLASASA
ncbi:MAG: asparagine synthase (glutamine-hydrolyzing) [Gemmatimonadaceae bacterium]